MKSKLYLPIFLLILAILITVSCSKGKTGEANKDKGTIQSETAETTPTPEAERPNLTELAQTLTPDILKEAHNLVAAYPNATWDNTKGSYSKVPLGQIYNIVYTSTDPIDKVAEFFRTNISKEYLKEIKSPEGDSKKWIHFQFEGQGFKHKAKILLRDLNGESTEIVYYIENPSTPAKKEESKGS